ncbi:MAG TPA: DUF1016 N-terminal domain-containing protein [Bryobacteraceae bacterium]|nr:DUF1016 N-terminal domain-containing protein [Bryobacteraceae bacterium]
MEVSQLLEHARQSAGRAVNAVMSSTYWQIGRRIVEQKQKGYDRASYGEELVVNLARDLTARFGRGFSRTNVFQMRQFFLAYREKIQTPSESLEAQPTVQTLSGLSPKGPLFPLSWSHYVRLLTVPEMQARRYYEDESLRGGWSVRELDRQIASRAYERLRGKKRSSISRAERAAADCEIRDPFVLEFLNSRTSTLNRTLRVLS